MFVGEAELASVPEGGARGADGGGGAREHTFMQLALGGVVLLRLTRREYDALPAPARRVADTCMSVVKRE